jgi:hypothetical protein
MKITLETKNKLIDGEYKVEAKIIIKNGKQISVSELILMNMEDLEW